MLTNLHKIATSDAWLMTPAAHASMMRIIERMEDMPKRQGEICGEAVELPSMRVEDGTAVIPINGVMVRGVSLAEKVSGVVTVEDVERDIGWAVKSPDVKRIVLDIDSPGGMYNGTPELGDVIAKAAQQKPVASFTAGMMASAAYWSGSATGRVYMSKSASVGSIGVVLQWPDVSEAMKGVGVKIMVFSSGEYKGMTPEVELTDSQKSYLKERVMKLADEFYSHVKGQRAGANEAAFDGRVFMADEAMELGLIDGTARNIEEVIEVMKLEEQVQALVESVNQLRAENKEQREEIAALTDLVTEQAGSKEPQKKEEHLSAEKVKSLIAEALTENTEQMEKAAAKAVSKTIASAGQPGPIESNKQENLSAEDRTNAAFLAMARKMKGAE